MPSMRASTLAQGKLKFFSPLSLERISQEIPIALVLEARTGFTYNETAVSDAISDFETTSSDVTYVSADQARRFEFLPRPGKSFNH